MIPASRKRKHRSHRSHPQSHFKRHYGCSDTRSPYDHRSEIDNDSTTKPEPLHALYIQAYEADIVRGSHAQTTAQSLEVVEYSPTSTTIIPKIGPALIRWGGDAQHYGGGSGEDDMLPIATQGTESAVWVDR
jgi:hypothetical protein